MLCVKMFLNFSAMFELETLDLLHVEQYYKLTPLSDRCIDFHNSINLNLVVFFLVSALTLSLIIFKDSHEARLFADNHIK